MAIAWKTAMLTISVFLLVVTSVLASVWWACKGESKASVDSETISV